MHQHHPGPDDTDLARPDVPSELERMVAALGETLEHLPIAICICDLNGTIVQYNRHALEIWARTPAPGETHQHFTAGSRFYRADGQLLSPPEVPMAKALRTELPVREQEITVERQDGSRVVTVVNINPLKDSQGALLGAVNCFRDITDRKRIAEALKRSQEDLREQEQRLAATYEHAAIGIAEIAGDGRFLRVN